MKERGKVLKKQRFLLVMPLIVMPFITIIFWLLGGGSGNVSAQRTREVGLRAELPDAKIVGDPADKMDFYKVAEQDSIERMRSQKSDPYLREIPAEMKSGLEQTTLSNNEYTSNYSNSQQSAVYERINSLQRIIKEQDAAPIREKKDMDRSSGNGEIERLEKMMAMVQSDQNTPNSEMQQINTALENILDLQHPERVKEKLRTVSEKHKTNAYAVSIKEKPDPLSSFDRDINRNYGANGFFSIEDVPSEFEAQKQPSIAAVIHEDQTVFSGATVKLRLLDDIYVSGVLVKKDNFITGIANLTGDRLQIEVKSLRNDNSIFPVALSVYDLDGISGINIPGAISRDVAKQGSERTLQSLGLSSYDPSLGAQAAAAGMEITKNLLSKKVKLVRVQLKAGYRVLLFDEKQKIY